MLLTVGRIIRPHGVRGELLVEVLTDEPGTRYTVGAVFVTAPTAPPPDDPRAWRVPSTLTAASLRLHQGRYLATFQEVPDRDTAEALRGVLLQVDSAAIPPPADPDEFLDHQLVGLAAVTRAGAPLGEVVRVDHAPASDLLVVRRPDGRDALVPFVWAIVPEVDLAAGRVVIDPPPGLLDL